MSAQMKLEVFQNGQLLQEVPLNGDETSHELWVGRDEGCLIRLDDRAISRKHATLRATGMGVEFEKKSKFGWVKVNGSESSQALLKDGDYLELGPFEIRVKSELNSSKNKISEVTVPVTPTEPLMEIPVPVEVSHQDVNPPSVEEPMHSVVDPIPDFSLQHAAPMEQQTNSNFDLNSTSQDGATKVFTVPDRMRGLLMFGEGAANFTQYEIADNEIAIGRSTQCHIVLEDKRSSRKHALIKRDGLKYALKDLGSANGTLVNGSRVDEHELQSGDQIQIGETVFTFRLVQNDYEQKKAEFIPVPQQEMGSAPGPLQDYSDFSSPISSLNSVFEPAPDAAPMFEAPPEPKKSLIGKFLDRYRAMNTKQQVIYGAVILTAVWFLMQDDSTPPPAKLLNDQKKTAKKEDKKPGAGPTLQSLTPEQRNYIETQYQMGFDLYKNREYDKALLELSKIFGLVQDYKQAREIEEFARVGKRKLEAQEEERKRKDAEKQAQIKLKSMIEQAGFLMDKKRFKEAEALFPEIELIQPENVAVTEWRKQIMGEAERLDREREEKKRIADLHRQTWADFQEVRGLEAKKQYYDALDQLDELAERPLKDHKLIKAIQDEMKKIEDQITAERDPLLAQAKQLEQDGKLIEAYRAYQSASVVDPVDTVSAEGMKRTQGTLTARARSIYAEGVFAESYSDLDTAEKRYREVLQVVPKEDDYYAKAQKRLKKLTVFSKTSEDRLSE